MIDNIPKIKLAMCCVFYNDAKSLRRCMDSFVNGVDLMVCIDGRFDEFPGKTWLSDDGSREVVTSYKNAILDDYAHCDQIVKRNRYLQICKEEKINFAIIADSDEYVQERPDWKLFREELKRIVFERDRGVYNVYDLLHRDYDEAAAVHQQKPRIWYAPYNMEYYNRHFYFRNKDPGRRNTYAEGNHGVDIIKGIKLGHDHLLRSESHMHSRLIYNQWQGIWEGRQQ